MSNGFNPVDAELTLSLEGSAVGSIANNLTTTVEGYALDARRGKYLDEVKVGYTDIADDLTTSNAQKVLSAKQGVALKQAVDESVSAANAAQTTANGKVSAKTATVSLGASSWRGSAAPYTQTKNVSGVTADNIVIVAPAYAKQEQYYACGIGCSAQADGTLTFSATEKPTVAIGVNVLILY